MIYIKNKNFDNILDSLDGKCRKCILERQCGKVSYGISICPRGFTQISINDDLYCHFFLNNSNFYIARFKRSICNYYKNHTPKNGIHLFSKKESDEIIKGVESTFLNEYLGFTMHDITHVIRDIEFIVNDVDDSEIQNSEQLKKTIAEVAKLKKIIEQYKEKKAQLVDNIDYNTNPHLLLLKQLNINQSTQSLRIDAITKVLDICGGFIQIYEKAKGIKGKAFQIIQLVNGSICLIMCRIIALYEHFGISYFNSLRFNLSFLQLMLISSNYVAMKNKREIKITPNGIDLNIKMKHQFFAVVYILLENALKYSLENSDIKADVSKEEDSIVFTIENRCCGLEEHDDNYYIDKGKTGENCIQGDSSGLGLHIADTMAKNISGTLEIYPDSKNQTFKACLKCRIVG